jgi:uncharacterized membrane protein YvbJ
MSDERKGPSRLASDIQKKAETATKRTNMILIGSVIAVVVVLILFFRMRKKST